VAAVPCQIGIGGGLHNHLDCGCSRRRPGIPGGRRGGQRRKRQKAARSQCLEPADAIAGAAKYLLAHGVQNNVGGAIFATNHLQSRADGAYWAGPPAVLFSSF